MSSNIFSTENITTDPRFKKALSLFNSSNWYLAHDVFEELWHETLGPNRVSIQALLQISVAQLHLENGNLNGATILYGESLGRLRKAGISNLGLDIDKLSKCVEERLKLLQMGQDPEVISVPCLSKRP